jgi:hypothetical protein
MRANVLAAFTLALASALCALQPPPASAQPRDNVYVVGGVAVDETAANAAAAQQAGFATAQRLGFERLARRLTIPAELAARGAPAADAAAIEQLVLSVDVEEERRSGTRYIGRLTVRFDPSGVRALLRGQGLTVVDTRTSPVLVVPLAAPDVAPETFALWRQVWIQGGYGSELVPLSTAPEALQGPAAWTVAAPFAQAAGSVSALYATLRVQGATVSATLLEVAADAARDRGEVTVRVNGSDPGALRAALASLAEEANARIQNEWKARIATGGGQRVRVSASALYVDLRQWTQIKQALEGAAQTLISEIRIEAVGREGALVSFYFVGDRNQLVAELGRRGVNLQDSPQGPVLRVAGR